MFDTEFNYLSLEVGVNLCFHFVFLSDIDFVLNAGSMHKVITIKILLSINLKHLSKAVYQCSMVLCDDVQWLLPGQPFNQLNIFLATLFIFALGLRPSLLGYTRS